MSVPSRLSFLGTCSGGLTRLVSATAFLLGLLASSSLVAQSLASDEVPEGRTVPEKEKIEGDMQSAKLRLGPLRLLPSISIINAGYDSNVFASATDPVADWTATIRLGTRALMPLGSKMYFLADVFPDYVWYYQLSDRNRWGGTFDGALLGFFNRMSFQVRGSDTQAYDLYSAELPSYVFSNIEEAKGNVDVDLTRSLAVFGSGGYQRVRYTQYAGPPIQDLQVKLNNRNDTVARGGLRYTLAENWSVAALVEQSWSDFQYQPELRDNKSIAYLGGIYFNRERLFVNVMGGYREGTPNNGSTFPEYQTPVGSFFLSFFPLRWLELRGYGHRRVSYSIAATQPYFYDNKLGGGANIEFFDHVLLRGFVEDGPNTYPFPLDVGGGTVVDAVTHTKSYGGGFSIKLPARIVLSAQVTRQIYASNIPGQSQAFNRFQAFFNFSGEYSR